MLKPLCLTQYKGLVQNPDIILLRIGAVVAQLAHNQKVDGAIPSSATILWQGLIRLAVPES